MKPSVLPRLAGKTNLSRDQWGILLTLVIGIAGQLLVFLSPDPLELLAPQLPMLTPQDWPGSYIGTDLFFTDNGQSSYSPSAPWKPFLWEERRGFYQSLYLTQGDILASVDQTIVWYANPDENVEAWNQLDPETYNGWPIIEKRLSPHEPASYLACNPDLSSAPSQCWYLASWGHWFTAVFFYRQANDKVLIPDVHPITSRADQLLLSAPDEPCFGFLCTNSNQERNRSRR